MIQSQKVQVRIRALHSHCPYTLSQGVLVANRRSLMERDGVIQAVKDILERLEAHLRAADKFSVSARTSVVTGCRQLLSLS